MNSFYYDHSQDAYQYPDINDIIDQQERLKTKKSKPKMDKQNIVIRLVLGHFVSNEELRYLYKHCTPYEIADLDRVFQGRISASSYEAFDTRGLSRGYSEGYTSEVMEINGTRSIIMLPTATPDLDVEENSAFVTHTVLDVLENNLHEDFDEALRWNINNYPRDVIRALELDSAFAVKYVGCRSKRVESMWDQRWDDFKADVVLLADVDVTMPVTTKSGDLVLIEHRVIRKQIEYRLRYTFDLIGKTGKRTCTRPIGGPSAFFTPDKITTQKEWSTDASLRFQCKSDADYIRMTQKMLSAVYPEALEEPTKIDGDLLVERLSDYLEHKYHGMTVRLREECLGMNCGIIGQIIYADTIMTDGCGMPLELKAGDILINLDEIHRPSDRLATIAHECIHVFMDTPFFLLQMMAGTPPAFLDRSIKWLKAERKLQGTGGSLDYILPNRNTKYVFDEKEMKRFHVMK